MDGAQSEPLAKSLGPSYGAEQEKKTERAWVWRGNAWYLLFGVIQLFGQQFLMLIAVVVAVFTSHEYLMSCNPFTTSFAMATACEYTKAHVRCFPLLALVITTLSTTRVFLFLRAYYQLLQRQSLVKFDPYPAYKDPLFLIMVFCMTQAAMHFVLNIATAEHMTLDVKDNMQKIKADEFQGQVERLTAVYMIPTIMFFILFYRAYDISELVLPFSKYFEDDEKDVLEDVRSLTIVREVVAMRVVQFDLVSEVIAQEHAEPPGWVFGTCDENKVYAKFIEEAGQIDSGPELACWRLSTTWWPARLLLDGRIKGREHYSFKAAWWVLAMPMLYTVYFVVKHCYLQALGKYYDIRSGQYTDIAGLVVGLSLTAYSARLGYTFLKNTIISPFFGYKYKQREGGNA